MTEFCTWTLIVCFTLRTVILQPKHFKQFENKSESIAVTGLIWHHSLWFFSCSLKSPSHFNYIIMQWILNWGWMCVQPSPTLEMVSYVHRPYVNMWHMFCREKKVIVDVQKPVCLQSCQEFSVCKSRPERSVITLNTFQLSGVLSAHHQLVLRFCSINNHLLSAITAKLWLHRERRLGEVHLQLWRLLWKPQSHDTWCSSPLHRLQGQGEMKLRPTLQWYSNVSSLRNLLYMWTLETHVFML